MAKPATRITLNPEEEQTLRGWLRSHKTERRMVERAQMVLLAAADTSTTAIAQQLGTPPRRALRGASFTSPWQVRVAFDKFIAVYNQKATPFEWTKTSVTPQGLSDTDSYLCN